MKNFLSENKIDDKVIAVGVSGGADSLALALWAAEKAPECGIRIVALTVDHKLRKESTDEAKYVAELMRQFNIEHHILTWEGEKPDNGIEEAARIARYNLLKEWCFSNGIKSVMIAHHQLDQAETFFMRLHRGSGLDGLCGMSPVSDFEGLQILRPFLNTSPEKLKDFLRNKNIKWVEDASNQNEDFLRVKIRKFMPIFIEKTGIPLEKITKTMETLAKSKSYLENQTEKFIKNHCQRPAPNIISVSTKTLLQTHEEIVYRFFVVALKIVGNKIYSPRAEDVLRLQNKIAQTTFSGATLSDCEIFISRGKLWIIPEARNLQMPTKQQWQEFLTANEFWKRQLLPGKVRRIIFNNNKGEKL